MTRTRTLKALVGATACGFLATAPPGVGPAPVLADDYGEPITTQPYFDLLAMPTMRELGYTGEGVTVAVIDTPIDTSVPELAGVDIEVIDTGCSGDDLKAMDTYHGTAVASIIAAPAYGWAPKAKILSYVVPANKELELVAGRCEGAPSAEELMVDAVLRGADIVNMSITIPNTRGVGLLALEAIEHGGAIVPGVGNAARDDSTSDGGKLNGTIGVGAMDLNGNRSAFSNFGSGLTVLAPGEGITIRKPGQDGALSLIDPTGHGTSYAAPQVSGLLALGKQSYPDATMNQLTRALIDTAQHAEGGQWDPQIGWGHINPVAFLNADPTTYEDSNPLLDKSPDLPGAAELQDMQDGLLYPEFMRDPSYIYRGPDDIEYLFPNQVERCTSPRYEREGMPAECEQYLAEQAKSPEPGAADADAGNATTGAAGEADSSGASHLPWIIGGIAVLLLRGGGAATFAVLRRKKAPAAAGDVSVQAVPQQQPLPAAQQPPATPPTELTQWRPED